ncbi:hypothetical protein DUI87_00395 [Hirundo rustica rustica]|uniref:Epiplakin n=1 Tax=Hirundo rustica rustica TaxID=333673 RepID=A0A3M0LAH0_HIRRU|nr:hypothetical protein DUI87_00395 [Hirundo rustica rustica]
MSIYQALKKGLLTEQCALGLLEAQAATGFLLDPRNNQKLLVDEAVSSGLVGGELREQLLSAEKAVTGYTDPQTGSKMSLFQAVRQKIVVRDHGIRLLEAQIATGGIIDPVHGHRLPVEVAYRRGHLDEDTFLLLSDPDHGSKGFIDPNTREKISYSQLLQRCAKDGESGLYLLQVLEKEGDYFYIDEQTKSALLCTNVQVPVGKYKGQVLSLWELLCSEYVTEEKRKELVKKYKAESQHIVQGIIETILKIIREKEEGRGDVWFQGIRQQITASELLSAQIITEETAEKLQEGKKTAEEIAQIESVRRYLEGTGSIAGVLVPSKAEPGKMDKMSIYQAMWKGILRQGTALVLLEAQAATGFLVDPVKNQKLSVDEAVAAGLVGSELKNKLLSAEKAVTGYTHPYTGQKMSLFQAMKQELIVRDHGIRLLEAQIATGGIIDPVHSHRLPVEVAYKRGYFDQEMNQLLRRCVPDPDTGLLMLQLTDKGSVLYQLSEDARRALQAARTTLAPGLFQGQSVSVWELLFSRYVPEQRRQDLLRRYKAGTLSIAEMIELLTAIVTRAEAQGHSATAAPKSPVMEVLPEAVEIDSASNSQREQERERERERERELERSLKSHTVEVSAGGFHGRKVSLWELLFSKFVSQAKREELLGQLRAGSLALAELATLLTLLVEEAARRSSSVKFAGLRRQVSASDLLDSGIIDTGTLAELVQGARTVQEVTQMASVKRYLDGTGVIAGVLVPSKARPGQTEKMSIYQAMWKGVLRQGTALVLLEAQAATGFLVDPVKNQKLSVDEAVAAGLVGGELHEKLLSAERAVTGYTDPYTGDKISLFQAMQKELIVAYKRGYFDQEMNQVLSDPGDDTKGFFDPNTHENLTYLQLMERARGCDWGELGQSHCRRGDTCDTVLKVVVAWHMCDTVLKVSVAGHMCDTVLKVLVAGHMCDTVLKVSVAWHTCDTVLKVSVAWHMCDTVLKVLVAWHMCDTVLKVLVAWHMCDTVLKVLVAGHMCDTVLKVLVAWHMCDTVLKVSVAGHMCDTVLKALVAGHMCDTVLKVLVAWHTCDTVLKVLVAWHTCDTVLEVLVAWHMCDTVLKVLVAWHMCDTVLKVLVAWDVCDIVPKVLVAWHMCDIVPKVLVAWHVCDTVLKVLVAWHMCV